MECENKAIIFFKYLSLTAQSRLVCEIWTRSYMFLDICTCCTDWAEASASVLNYLWFHWWNTQSTGRLKTAAVGQNVISIRMETMIKCLKADKSTIWSVFCWILCVSLVTLTAGCAVVVRLLPKRNVRKQNSFLKWHPMFFLGPFFL